MRFAPAGQSQHDQRETCLPFGCGDVVSDWRSSVGDRGRNFKDGAAVDQEIQEAAGAER